MEQPPAETPEPSDELMGRIDVIEAQPLADRARGYDQLAEALLTELQRSDHEAE